MTSCKRISKYKTIRSKSLPTERATTLLKSSPLVNVSREQDTMKRTSVIDVYDPSTEITTETTKNSHADPTMPLTIKINPHRVSLAAPPNSPAISALVIRPKKLSRELRALTDTKYFERLPKGLPASRTAGRKVGFANGVTADTQRGTRIDHGSNALGPANPLQDDARGEQISKRRRGGPIFDAGQDIQGSRLERKRHKVVPETHKIRVIGVTSPNALRLTVDDSTEESAGESEGPTDERISLGDIATFRISHLMQDLSLESRQMTNSQETLVLPMLSQTLQDVGNLVQAMHKDAFQSQDELDLESIALDDEPGSPPDPLQDLFTSDPNQAFRTFKESIRLFSKHLLGISLDTPIENWPTHSICGRFHLDPRYEVDETSNSEGMDFFVTSYIEAYQSQAFQPLQHVYSEYVSPLLIREMYRDNFLVIRNAFGFHSTRESKIQQRVGVRKERKRKKLQRRRVALSSRFQGDDFTRLCSAVCLEAMSDEESDEEDSTLIWIVEPTWRSSQLAVFLHKLDGPFKPLRRHAIRLSTNDSAVIPDHLPINLYSKEWMRSSAVGLVTGRTAADPLVLEIA